MVSIRDSWYDHITTVVSLMPSMCNCVNHFSLYYKLHHTFQHNWLSITVQAVYLRELLFCFSNVIASDSFLCLLYNHDGRLPSNLQLLQHELSSKTGTHQTKGKSTNQQIHKLNMCVATAHYQHKKEPAAIKIEKQNSISLKHITCTVQNG
jgi:hypothetical protein